VDASVLPIPRLNAVELNSAKLDFYGHERKHPMAEGYHSQTLCRYGDYVAKIGFVPDTPGLRALFDQSYNHKTPGAFREAANAFFRVQTAEFAVVVQLNTGAEDMPVEDAKTKWPENLSQYQTVARLIPPAQTASML
jgi:hypothetical protein